MIREPAVAGTFYPNDPQELGAVLKQMLTAVHTTGQQPKALIVPHAGYVYSGPIAARAYAELIPYRDKIQRVVLLGPAHRIAFNGLALSSAKGFQTPLGICPLNSELQTIVAQQPHVSVLDAAHSQEHSLEVQLPFLQMILKPFTILPIAVGHTTTDTVDTVLECIWGEMDTLIIISSDLSHYHDYQTAQNIDRQTVNAIESFDTQRIGPQQACGCYPINGLLQRAKKNGLLIKTLDVRNSGDTAGNQDQVVGYAAFGLYGSA